ncbi:uncharacterized protein BX663DRAFT_515188 [Cokeromyces recurvatus]|uniref:uncharacterized protein n=1 Tax=Cokeromyces recurvatus TaxID=90255 RepID=UPI0022207F3C|nr:uncharacterized protein BX663DRAFT_515186 [Cokeromyces recurvatus]XP_051381165.1 uncharacterized protein BX663DRAFT_515188 [Cokeromyces recurvatus]KAI7901178.1 hypothetical protein BX663DRAFT_515186 [Cokeromyces recurvatus]KAI7901180.1 hypothetical protein BX663DRAFT_515188 [Cokeromyces recurvatus]
MKWIVFLKLKGYYIVINNAPIHTSNQIDEDGSCKGERYKSVYLPLSLPPSLPPYSP